jgi:hypothetical protein
MRAHIDRAERGLLREGGEQPVHQEEERSIHTIHNIDDKE